MSVKGFMIHESIGIGIVNPRAVKRVVGSEKLYELPKKWIDELIKAKVPIPKSITPPAYFAVIKKDAIQICRLYLQITDKNWWPTLLGESEIMDEVLDEEFRK